jgi:PEP-CTERM motif-containing protein
LLTSCLTAPSLDGCYISFWSGDQRTTNTEERPMKKPNLALFAAGALLSTSAFAIPIALPSGPLFVEFLAAEQYSKKNDINNIKNLARAFVTEGNWGIVEITTISVGTVLSPTGWQITGPGQTIFSNGQNPGLIGGQQILGIFYGVLNNPGGPPDTSTGGVLDLYFWNDNNQTISINTPFLSTDLLKRNQGGSQSLNAGDQYLGFTCLPNTLGCTFLARFDFTFGADVTGVNTNTIFTPTGSPTSETYLSVDTTTVGAWTDLLNSNFFTLNPNQQTCGSPGVACLSPNDLRLDTTFKPNGGWDVIETDIIGLGKNGSFRAFVVPEPNSLALLSIGLAVSGAVGARRRAKAQPKNETEVAPRFTFGG